MTRTTDEIVARIAARMEADFFGFEMAHYIERLPFDQAKPHLKPEITADAWTPNDTPPLEEMRDYLAFAWGKANNQRGLSAGRSISHCIAWSWLGGCDALADFLTTEYDYYGKGHLVAISEVVGFDWRAADDGCWTGDEGSPGIGDVRRDALIRDMVEKAAAMKPS